MDFMFAIIAQLKCATKIRCLFSYFHFSLLYFGLNKFSHPYQNTQLSLLQIFNVSRRRNVDYLPESSPTAATPQLFHPSFPIYTIHSDGSNQACLTHWKRIYCAIIFSQELSKKPKSLQKCLKSLGRSNPYSCFYPTVQAILLKHNREMSFDWQSALPVEALCYELCVFTYSTKKRVPLFFGVFFLQG